ncbi:hypothetical protein TNCV_2283031 [Trichonephila clavipes]|uniref:Uncharacterized protein n=1 Tax=Trichonephila clavipes TaxID=2585209 RepID=A0A8X6RG31_TRICX|nr:hypothetical protein TNCV_2283031 [Trichonephila clavipes]
MNAESYIEILTRFIKCLLKDPCGEGYAAEELRASSVTAPRNALPKAVPKDEELGCGWLGERRGLAHIEKSSMALALDRARQHVMGVSPLSSFEESSGGYTGHVRKVWEFVAWRELEGIRVAKKWRQPKRIAFWLRKGFRLQRPKKVLSFLG